MEVIDGEGRVFGIVNVIDLLVLVFVLAVVAAGGALLVTDLSTSESQTESVTLTVQATDVQPYVAGAVPGPGSVDAGNVTRIENTSVEPAEIVTTNASGAVLVQEHPRLKTVELTVTVDAENRSGELYFERHKLRVNSAIGLDLGTVVLSGQITAVETGR
jgi:hypothetical protein